MVAVMVDSQKVGGSSWVASMGLRLVEVSGVVGDHVGVCCIRDLNDPESVLDVFEDGMYELPEGTAFVRVDHIKTGDGGRVYVDLR